MPCSNQQGTDFRMSHQAASLTEQDIESVDSLEDIMQKSNWKNDADYLNDANTTYHL